MNRAILLITGVLLCARAAPAASGGSPEIPGVSFTIREDTYISSPTATICRVTATNHSGRSLQGRRLVFEARAREHGVVVAKERGRFGGLLENGGTVETVIAFTGVFRDFEVGPAAGGADSSSGAARRGKKGGGSRPKKAKKRR